MPTEQELLETYEKMQTADLLNVISNKNDYTEVAVSVALDELKKRKVSIDEINAQKPVNDPYKKLWMENCLFDLSPVQKAAFYFLWLPVLIIYRFSMYNNYSPDMQRSRLYKTPGWLRFKSDGYILRGEQASYYKITGFAFFVISIITCNNILSNNPFAAFWVYWIAGFGISFLFDVVYNRQRLSDKLNDYKERGELPWGV